jgi:hypothetical protein
MLTQTQAKELYNNLPIYDKQKIDGYMQWIDWNDHNKTFNNTIIYIKSKRPKQEDIVRHWFWDKELKNESFWNFYNYKLIHKEILFYFTVRLNYFDNTKDRKILLKKLIKSKYLKLIYKYYYNKDIFWFWINKIQQIYDINLGTWPTKKTIKRWKIFQNIDKDLL